jgi:hypothetical protein
MPKLLFILLGLIILAGAFLWLYKDALHSATNIDEDDFTGFDGHDSIEG